MRNKFVAVSPAGNASFGDTPLDAVEQYTVEYGDTEIEDIDIYKLTGYHAKRDITVNGTEEVINPLP